jgi:hypothetical protein
MNRPGVSCIVPSMIVVLLLVGTARSACCQEIAPAVEECDRYLDEMKTLAGTAYGDEFRAALNACGKSAASVGIYVFWPDISRIAVTCIAAPFDAVDCATKSAAVEVCESLGKQYATDIARLNSGDRFAFVNSKGCSLVCSKTSGGIQYHGLIDPNLPSVHDAFRHFPMHRQLDWRVVVKSTASADTSREAMNTERAFVAGMMYQAYITEIRSASANELPEEMRAEFLEFFDAAVQSELSTMALSLAADRPVEVVTEPSTTVTLLSASSSDKQKEAAKRHDKRVESCKKKKAADRKKDHPEEDTDPENYHWACEFEITLQEQLDRFAKELEKEIRKKATHVGKELEKAGQKLVDGAETAGKKINKEFNKKLGL